MTEWLITVTVPHAILPSPDWTGPIGACVGWKRECTNMMVLGERQRGRDKSSRNKTTEEESTVSGPAAAILHVCSPDVMTSSCWCRDFSFKNSISHNRFLKKYWVNIAFFSFWREVLKLFLVLIMNKFIFKRFNNQSVSL